MALHDTRILRKQLTEIKPRKTVSIHPVKNFLSENIFAFFPQAIDRYDGIISPCMFCAVHMPNPRTHQFRLNDKIPIILVQLTNSQSIRGLSVEAEYRLFTYRIQDSDLGIDH